MSISHVRLAASGLFYDFKPTDGPIYHGAPNRLKLAPETTPLDNASHAAATPARRKAQARELDLAAPHQGKPGAPADPTDTPRL